MDRPDRPRGFTLIELLVVVVIIGVLVGLILPAVQAARESARSAECSNRLRQIGIGLASHQSARGNYPRGSWTGTDAVSGGGCLSPQCQLLPYLEQRVLYDAANFVVGFPANAAENQTVAATVVAAFLCPSDPSGTAGGTSYRACVSSGPGVSSVGLGGGGSFTYFDQLGPAQFTDGLSQTVGFSERLHGSTPTTSFDRSRDIWYSNLYSLGGPTSVDEMLETCGALQSAAPEVFLKAGASWIFARYEDSLYNHVAPPNWSGMDCGADIAPLTPNSLSTVGAFSARSRHGGGVNTLFMDGSTHFVRSSIALPVWRALATRAGGDVVDGSTY